MANVLNTTPYNKSYSVPTTVVIKMWDNDDWNQNYSNQSISGLITTRVIQTDVFFDVSVQWLLIGTT